MAVNQILLRLEELLLPSIADVAVLSVDADIAIVRVAVHRRGRLVSGLRRVVSQGAWLLPALPL